jgi:hypothetical protein
MYVTDQFYPCRTSAWSRSGVLHEDDDGDVLRVRHQARLHDVLAALQAPEDPRAVVDFGVWYKRRSGKGVRGEIGRDPSLGLPPGTVRECYKCFRRFCCDTLGSAADRAIASITTKMIVRARLRRRSG